MYSDICEGVGVSVFSIYYPQDGNLLKQPVSFRDQNAKLCEEVIEWLEENVPNEYKIVDDMFYQIEVWIYDHVKATLFKMRWG